MCACWLLTQDKKIETCLAFVVVVPITFFGFGFHAEWQGLWSVTVICHSSCFEPNRWPVSLESSAIFAAPSSRHYMCSSASIDKNVWTSRFVHGITVSQKHSSKHKASTVPKPRKTVLICQIIYSPKSLSLKYWEISSHVNVMSRC